MQEYRIFLLDRAGRISSCIEVVCADDDEALKAANEILQPGQEAELWQLRRLVGRITAERRALP